MSAPIWNRLVGQDHAVEELERAVHDAEQIRHGLPGPGMTHAWLITGPPGSGRSTAATSFAAALACPEDGCGVCEACRTVPLGGYPDVDVITTEELRIKVDAMRELVLHASLAPIKSPWHVVVMEDADRLTEQAVNAILKALEEPPAHTVWILCAPSVEDVLPTIVSRTRHIALRTPSAHDVAALLVEKDGIDPAMAAFAARASQGHIGRARALARDEHARLRRQEVLRIPLGLMDVPSCFVAAANLLEAATEDARAITDPLDAIEADEILAQFGDASDNATKARIKRLAGTAQKDMERRQKARRTRTVRDQVDRALVDLQGLFRDVLVVQVDSGVTLINEEMRPQIAQYAGRTTDSQTGRRMQAIAYARQQLESNVTPLLVLESLMVELKDPWIRTA